MLRHRRKELVVNLTCRVSRNLKLNVNGDGRRQRTLQGLLVVSLLLPRLAPIVFG